MRLTLHAKVSLTVALIIIAVSAISTALFISTYNRSKYQGRVIRGSALSYALAKSAEEGLLKEDLNLIKKAAAIIQAPDVMQIQVFSNVWDPIDAYPFERLQDAPDPRALLHYRSANDAISFPVTGGYDFYEPILFRPDGDTSGFPIGYVRLLLSSASIKQDIRNIITVNVAVTALVAFAAIVLINILMGRLVIKPVMALHRSVALFQEGNLDPHSLPAALGEGEIADLSREFRHLLVTVRDREQQLTDSDQRIRSLFERVEHGIFRIDEHGTIVERNGRFRDLFGDASGLCDILIGERPATDCLRRASAEKGLHIEDRAVGRGGAELHVSLSLYPRSDASGQVSGFDGYLIDVTEKKRLEERLIRSQKLEAVGTLAGGMAHDFNNLLTAILGYSSILLKSLSEGDPLFKPASIIHNAAKRGAEFGKKILTITRKEKLQTRPVQVNELVNSSMELLLRSMPKNIDIAVHLDEHLPLTNGDPAQIQQVIINLAVNARDAMPDGGKMVIETAVIGASANGQAAGDPDPFIRLSVSDAGAGIDTETQTRIFDPFYTTKDVGKGTGLGLYIVQSVVNKHGGYINLYSEPGQGTRFNVYLPVTKTSAGEILNAPEDLKGTGTILVIDDEADVRELCRDILTPLGYTVLLSESGPVGINLYRERKDDIQLVILDMVMPKMGGTEVFHALRNIDPAVRILLYSGYSNKNFAGIDELLRMGALGFMQKPFTNVDLAVMVKKAFSSAGPGAARSTS
ncbi:MAG: ATP-binding protein [Nitrospirota bacterium]|nr:ATP-binding protein [Nitrospirota bacterium]